MKVILITLVAFVPRFAHADDFDEDSTNASTTDYVDVAKASETCGMSPSQKGLPNCGGTFAAPVEAAREAARARLVEAQARMEESRTRLIAYGVQLETQQSALQAKLAAETTPVVDAPPTAAELGLIAADSGLRWEGGVGFDIGSFHTANVSNSAVGLDFEAGVRLDRLALLGEYRLMDLASSSDSTDDADVATLSANPTSPSFGTPSGFVQRFGLDVRYSILESFTTWANDNSAAALRSDLWLEADVGEQWIQWEGGGKVHRPDIGFGLGWSLGGRGPDHHAAYFMEVRTTLARPPDTPAMAATCAGPCDTATPPVDIDLSILFSTGITFGN